MSHNLCSEKLTLIAADGACHTEKETIKPGNWQGCRDRLQEDSGVEEGVISPSLWTAKGDQEEATLNFHTQGVFRIPRLHIVLSDGMRMSASL